MDTGAYTLNTVAVPTLHANFLGVKECAGNQRIQVPTP